MLPRSDFVQAIAALCEATGVDMPPSQAKAWYLVLGDLTAEQLAAGVISVLRSHKYPGLPPVGVVHDAALASTGSRALTVDDRATVAWEKLLEAIRRFGGYHSIEFDDPVIAVVVTSLGGWVTVSGMPSDELGRFVRPMFLKSYAAHARAGTTKAPALPGLIAADAGRHGHALPATVNAATGIPRLAVDPPPRERQPVANLAGKVGQALPLPEKFQAKPVAPKPSFDKSDVKQQLADWQAAKGSQDAAPPPAARRKKNKPAPPADHPDQNDAA